MKIIQPRKELRPYVRYYWVLESDEPFCTLTFPLGCTQIIFHKKTPLYISELNTSQPQFAISGQVNFPAHIQSFGQLFMIVAVFYPHTIGMFIDTPPSAFYNLEISGDELGNRDLTEIAYRVIESEDIRESIKTLESFLLSKIKPSVNIRRIEESIRILLHSPYNPVSTLADVACLCRRQYERIFQETVGMNPKEYSRIVRFQKALRLMQQGQYNYAGIAAECGYSDQSHFIRDFKGYSGHTPDSLCKYCKPYSDLFSNPA